MKMLVEMQRSSLRSLHGNYVLLMQGLLAHIAFSFKAGSCIPYLQIRVIPH
jgi:hypothetical protein